MKTKFTAKGTKGQIEVFVTLAKLAGWEMSGTKEIKKENTDDIYYLFFFFNIVSIPRRPNIKAFWFCHTSWVTICFDLSREDEKSTVYNLIRSDVEEFSSPEVRELLTLKNIR